MISSFYSVSLEPALGSPDKYPNIDYLGSCYNIIYGNPQDTSGLDPGFLAKGIFQYTYSQGLTTADGRYSIPDHTTVNDAQSCSFAFSSSITKNSGSYMDSLKLHVDANFKGWGASFSASADYQQVSDTTQNGQTIYVSSQAQCEAYGASVDGAEFTDDFTNSVFYLPETLDSTTKGDYLTFIQVYGTHIATALRMGGRYGVRSEFTAQSYSSLSSSGFNIKASAGYSGTLNLGASLDTDTQQQAAESYNDHRSSYTIYQVGGNPPVDENETAFEWAQTVKEHPLPLSYHLTEILKYFTPYYFPNDTSIARKGENLRNVTLEYCMLQASDTGLCQKDFGPGKKDAIYVSVGSEYVTALFPIGSRRESYSYSYARSPVFRTFGAILGDISVNIIMINIQLSSPELIVASIGTVGDADDAKRYQCPDGYSTVTDDVKATIAIATSHVCIANHCLTQCRQIETSMENIFMIGDGFPELGNSGNTNKGSFFRDLSIYDPGTSVDELFKCLSYDCLTPY